MKSLSETFSHKDYLQFLDLCESLIKQGKLQSTLKQLHNIKKIDIPRDYQARLARICRRVGALSMGIKVLSKTIYHKIPGEAQATSSELGEYAVLLSRIGSIDEAITILSQLNPNDNYDLILYHSYCLMSKWNYSDAAEKLELFLKVSQDSYLKLVAQVNLASCFISTKKYKEALELLNDFLIRETASDNRRLLGNCYELRGQIYFHQNLISKAETDLCKAQEILQLTNTYDELLVRKWKLIILSHKTNDTEPLNNLKKIATEKSHWETVREADLYSLKIKYDQNKYDFLYFGTPYESFRLKLTDEIQKSPSSFYTLGDPNGMKISLMTGEFISSQKSQISPKLHNLLITLTDDFYAPLWVGAIFSKTYPGEYFDIDSSPIRVRQIISNLRKWFLKNKIECNIVSSNGRYKLQINNGISFEINTKKFIISAINRNFEILKKNFDPGTPFTINDLASKVEGSRSHFHRLIRWALNHKFIVKFGKGKATRYQFNDFAKDSSIKTQFLHNTNISNS